MPFFDVDDIIGCTIGQPIGGIIMLEIENILRQRVTDLNVLQQSLKAASPTDKLKMKGLIAGLKMEIGDLEVILNLLKNQEGFSMSSLVG